VIAILVEIEYLKAILESMKNNTSIRSVIYIGLNGTGKTVLLNSIEEIADEMEVVYEHIEVDPKVDFITQLIATFQTLTRKVSVKEKAEKEHGLYNANNLSKSLTDAFVALGKAAKVSETPIAVFINEIQYLKEDQIAALAVALHRVNQLDYPITLIGAGLPQTRRLFGDAKSYSERLFEYREISNLDK